MIQALFLPGRPYSFYLVNIKDFCLEAHRAGNAIFYTYQVVALCQKARMAMLVKVVVYKKFKSTLAKI